jgi:PAS domain S-box-containing protein
MHHELDCIVDNDFLTNVFDCIQDGVSILDKDLNIIFANKKMNEWYGDGRPLVGRKCYEAYHSLHERCEKYPSVRTLCTGEMQHEVKHGSEYLKSPYRDMWIDLYSFPQIEHGRVTGVIEHVRDITERVKAQNSLKHAKEEYRNLV